jgi:stage II sporulation protein M
MLHLNFRQFILENKRWVRLILKLFFLGVLFGSVAAFIYPELMTSILEAFAERFGDNPSLDANLASQIFLQNITVALMAWLGGILLGILPMLIVLVNGVILGYVITFVIRASTSVGHDVLFLIAGLLPHGILELPAFLLASVLGLSLGLTWLRADARGQRFAVLKQTFFTTVGYFFYIILALILAAIIEVFVSGQLVSKF